MSIAPIMGGIFLASLTFLCFLFGAMTVKEFLDNGFSFRYWEPIIPAGFIGLLAWLIYLFGWVVF